MAKRASFWTALFFSAFVVAPVMASNGIDHRPPKFGPCHIRGSKLLFHDAQVLIVKGLPLPTPTGPIQGTFRKLYSCTPHGRAHFVISIGYVGEDDQQDLDHVTLAGNFGAFHVTSGVMQTDIFGNVDVFNLAKGRLVAQDVATSDYNSPLTALVLNRAGTAAWTYSSWIDQATNTTYPAGQPGAPVSLYGASLTHKATQLGLGVIDPASVSVSSTTVSWTDAGVPQQKDLSSP